MVTVDCAKAAAVREVNAAIRAAVAQGAKEVRVVNPAARHNLAVGILQPVRVLIEGSVGYYCGGMGDGPTMEITGSAGWGLAECILAGTMICRGSAGNGAAASIRGGTVAVHGNAAARAGISMKGGTLLIGGDTGYMTGFMMQKGTIVVCGNAAEGLGDSMYAGEIFVGGKIAALGNDAIEKEMTAGDRARLTHLLEQHGFDGSPPVGAFRKIVTAGKLLNFSKHDFEVWRVAL